MFDGRLRRERTGSLGTLEELNKRKREETDKSEEKANLQVFKKSVKTTRSPEKEEKMNEGIEMVLKKLEYIQNELVELKSSNQALQRENQDLRHEIRKYQGKLEQENCELREKIVSWEEKVRNIEWRIEKREKEDRKNNIIISEKLEENIGKQHNLRETHVKELLEKLTETKYPTTRIVETQYLTRRQNGTDVIRVKLDSWEAKNQIMKNKYKLARYDKRVFIDDDLTNAEAEIQKNLREKARNERLQGRKVKVGYRKICIEGKWTKWEDL